MQTVSAIPAAVNDLSYEEAIRWHQQKAERGDLSQITSRLRISAINSIVSVLGPDEPREAAWIYDNAADLGRRWAIKNQGNGATAAAYISRSRAALGDWIAWRKEPTKFRFKEAATRHPRRKEAVKTEATPPQTTLQVVTAPPEVTPAPPPAATPMPATGSAVPPVSAPPSEYVRKDQPGDLRACPLGPEREPFRYVLPSDGLTLKDVRRICYHLATMCEDYDPMVSPTQVFSIVPRADN